VYYEHCNADVHLGLHILLTFAFVTGSTETKLTIAAGCIAGLLQMESVLAQ
jgi:hypothetical protein